MPINTAGMLCICGKRLVNQGTYNGCYVIGCPVCDKRYNIPADPCVVDNAALIAGGWKPPASPPDAVRNSAGADNQTAPYRPKSFEAARMGEGEKLHSESLKPGRIYKCRDCGNVIDREQAERTYEEGEQALCVMCEGK